MSRYVKDANGVWHAVAGLESIDSTPTEGSTAAVSSGGVYASEQSIRQALTTTNNVLGAKNLLRNTASTQTASGVTFTVNSDGSVTVNGTPTETVTLNINTSVFLENGRQYILSGCPEGGEGNKYCISCYIGGVFDIRDYGAGDALITGTGQNAICRIILWASAGAVNFTFYPMIRPASITDDTYVPYAMTNRELTQELRPTKTCCCILPNKTGGGFFALTDVPKGVTAGRVTKIIPLGTTSYDVSITVLFSSSSMATYIMPDTSVCDDINNYSTMAEVEWTY